MLILDKLYFSLQSQSFLSIMISMVKGLKEIIDLIPGGAPKEEQELIAKAYDFAKKAHEGQKRKSGEPYFIHVEATARILADLGMDSTTIAAGLLHDTIEDTPVTENDVKEGFGEEILFLVNGVTKLGTLKYRGRERHVESLRKFFIAMTNDLRVVIIKFADRLHNLRTLQYVPEEKRERIALESIDVYAPLAHRLGMGKLKGLLEDAAFPYAYPEEYEQMEKIIKAKSKSYEKQIAEIKKKIESELKKQKVNVVEMDHRLKQKYSLYRKLLRRDMDLERIYDIVAMRIVVKSIADCYKTLGVIHSVWKPVPGRIKDYIASPKTNGYRSLHTTIFTGEGDVAEIQIRTVDMHAEAAYGIAAHFAYKENGQKKSEDDKSKFKWIEELREMNYNPQDPKNYLDKLKTEFFSDRVFVFTPEGDVIDLPDGSTPIDFAYAVHSEIGDHVSGARINSKMSQIFAELTNGDVVEIMTSKKANPSSKWLAHAKSATARKNIRSYLEKNSLLAKLKSFGKN